jgi:hypothetical protein
MGAMGDKGTHENSIVELDGIPESLLQVKLGRLFDLVTVKVDLDVVRLDCDGSEKSEIELAHGVVQVSGVVPEVVVLARPKRDVLFQHISAGSRDAVGPADEVGLSEYR